MPTSNPLLELAARGQSVWLDFIDHNLLASGRLHDLIARDGLRGVTSNPTIFDEAIARTAQYDKAIREALAADPDVGARDLYETLAVMDIRQAADALRPVHDASGGLDGFACLEVSPWLARDAEATVEEARRLHALAGRPNVMIKVPGTPEGMPAIERLVADGIPVNVTLLFSVGQYEPVARAYLRGRERSAAPGRAASVASLFVSRIDARVDRMLEALGSPEALSLRGRAAIAVARVVHERFRRLCADEGMAGTGQDALPVQRLLWASTGTKNPAYSDVRYVEALVAPRTVTTMPTRTLDAFRDHGRVRGDAALQDVEEAHRVLDAIEDFGVRAEPVAQDLQREGVEKFSASFDHLLHTLERRRQERARV